MKMSSNEKTVEKFLEFCVSGGLSEKRIKKYKCILKNICKWLVIDFKKATKEDIQELVKKIVESDYSEWTKRDYKLVIKRFYKWLEGDDEEYPKKVRWIKLGGKNLSNILSSDLLTEEEVKQLIENACEIRNKAVISVLYESGCRIGELLGMRIKDVEPNGNMVRINVSGKTGSRPIPLVTSIPYLSMWINNHPNKNDPDSSLFVSIGTRNNSDTVGRASIAKMLRKTAKRADIKKRVNPHNFRHSRASFMARAGFNESYMRVYFGWSKGSDMPDNYVHMSGRDLDDPMLEFHDLKNTDARKSKKILSPVLCPRCKENNPPTNTLCMNCGLPLTEKAMVEHDKRMDELVGFLSKKENLEKLIDERLENKIKQLSD